MSDNMKALSDPDYLDNLSKGFSDLLVTGKFCDVKIICQDSNLWAHRMVLSTVSPFLRNMLLEMEKRGDDVITIFLPRIKGYHMKLVLDYIYGGAMYLCGAHMQYVIQVMEVLNLNCGVSVNKMVQSTAEDRNWIEVEHSTVKIKSNFPPKLPEYGETSGRRKPPASISSSLQSSSSNKEAKLPKGTSCLPVDKSKKKKDGKSSSEPKDVEKSVSEPEKDSRNNDPSSEEQDNNQDVEGVVVDESDNNMSDDNNITEIVDIAASDEDDFEKEKDEEQSVFHNSRSDQMRAHEDSHTSASPLETTENIENDDNGSSKEDEGQDIDEEDEEPVVVEIDEDFAIDSLSRSQAEQNEGRKHKCALCGRTFRFFENLRVHLTGHLGVKVTLIRCRPCKRNFKNQNELDLHMKAHSYARHLGKYRLARSAAEAAAAKATNDVKVITTVGTKDKKILRKYTKNRSSSAILTRKKEKPVVETQPEVLEKPKRVSPLRISGGTPDLDYDSDKGPTSGQQFSCDKCDKSFIVKSLYLRHMKQKHSESKNTPQPSNKAPKVASVIISKSNNGKRHSISSHPSSAPSTPVPATAALSSLRNAAHSSSQKENPYSRQYSTPSRKRDFSESSEMSSPTPHTPPVAKKRRLTDTLKSGGAKNANSLQCSDCDKVFVAKSILERHQYTAKHGVYGTYSSDSGPGSPSLHHRTERQVDCHLCGQVFVRVKDLVKHRQKVCTAWQNPGN